MKLTTVNESHNKIVTCLIINVAFISGISSFWEICTFKASLQNPFGWCNKFWQCHGDAKEWDLPVAMVSINTLLCLTVNGKNSLGNEVVNISLHHNIKNYLENSWEKLKTKGGSYSDKALLPFG